MQGFKSFPDKTRINVSPGMTVVVGPNGSGKSNISDAIRWVLGELSSKNMRGNKMEDVIFGGCDSRRPMGFAEVSLTFDNTKGEISLNLPYDEVCVTRKYYRTGYSDYMINRKSVRLKDITDLFMNTGLGKSGYSIIGQGRIAEIISKKSEERRGIFEEAAGISRYRVKKTDAERKLAEVEINLSTAEILKNNLESQLGPLEKQSIKAKKYTALRDEKMKLDIAVWLWEIDNVKSKAEELTRKYEIAQHEYDIADDEVRSLEAKNERISQLIRENNEKTDKYRLLARQYEEEKNTHKNLFSVMENEIAHIDENVKRLSNELSEIRRDGTDYINITDTLKEKLDEAQKAIDELRMKFTKKEAELAKIREDISLLDESIERSGEYMEDLSEKIVNAKLELSTLKASSGGNNDKSDSIKAAIEEERENLESCLKNEKSIGETLNDYKKKQEKLSSDISALEEKRLTAEKKLRASEDKKRQSLINVSALEARWENLKRMDEHFDGLAASVRLVMDWSRRGLLDGICGPVSSLISTMPEYSTALETALGASLQNIVCINDTYAKKAIGKLKAEKGGIVTFYPLNTLRSSKLNVDIDKLKKCEGFIDIAGNLIECDGKYRHVIDFLLGRTVICTDIEAAGKIGKIFDYRFKIVTLDGQTVNAGGSFTGGSHKQSSGILTRRAEIASLEAKAMEIKKEIADLEKAITDLAKEEDDILGDISLLQSDLDITDGLKRNAEFEARINGEKLRECKKELARLINELDGLGKLSELTQKKISDTEALILSLENDLAKAKKENGELKEQRSNGEKTRAEIIDEKNALDSKLGISVSSLEYTKRELEAASKRALSLASNEQKNITELDALSARRISLKESMEEEKSKASHLEKEIKSLDAEVSVLKTTALEYELSSAKLKGAIKDKTTHRENCFKVLTRAKEQAEFVNTEQDKYLSLLWDEYDLTYAAAEQFPHDKLTPETKTSAVTAQNRLKRQMKELGDVNLASIEEYATKKLEYEELEKQYSDLVKSKTDYSDIVRNMERQMKSMFTQTFNKINENFTVVFSELFGGGRGELSLTDPTNVLESGIEISVAPPGKIIKSLSLLSGGEQVFVAIALFFAILRVTPAPFCLLDEIEAALDEVNVKRFANYAKKFSDKTQFIIISHRRGTMELADTLYGVTMQQRGVSNVLSIEVNEIEEKLGLKDIK